MIDSAIGRLRESDRGKMLEVHRRKEAFLKGNASFVVSMTKRAHRVE